MNISIPPELEKFIHGRVNAGLSSSESDVVRQALELFKSNEDFFEEDIEWLRREIAIGLNEADRGLSAPWDPDKIWDEVEKLHAESTVDKKVG